MSNIINNARASLLSILESGPRRPGILPRFNAKRWYWKQAAAIMRAVVAAAEPAHVCAISSLVREGNEHVCKREPEPALVIGKDAANILSATYGITVKAESDTALLERTTSGSWVAVRTKTGEPVKAKLLFSLKRESAFKRVDDYVYSLTQENGEARRKSLQGVDTRLEGSVMAIGAIRSAFGSDDGPTQRRGKEAKKALTSLVKAGKRIHNIARDMAASTPEQQAEALDRAEALTGHVDPMRVNLDSIIDNENENEPSQPFIAPINTDNTDNQPNA